MEFNYITVDNPLDDESGLFDSSFRVSDQEAFFLQIFFKVDGLDHDGRYCFIYASPSGITRALTTFEGKAVSHTSFHIDNLLLGSSFSIDYAISFIQSIFALREEMSELSHNVLLFHYFMED